jgi:hypothetical protein
MATLDSSNIVNGNVIEPNDILQLYNALNYNNLTSSYLVEISGSLLGTSSFATTASFALNCGGGGGGVTQIIAGPNITITSTGPSGTGDVTISSSGGGSSFPFVGNAVITGSLSITGSNAGADLAIVGSVFASDGFTGSLQGTSTNTALAATAISGLTSSKVTITNNTSTNIDLPLIFASSSTPGTQQLSFDNDANGPYINPLNNSIEALSFTGSLLGTASQAANSTLATSAISNTQPYPLVQISNTNSNSLLYYLSILNYATLASALSASTVSNTTSQAAHFLTFVNSNNTPAASEQLFTNPGLIFQPAINGGTLIASVLSASNISASSITSSAGFTGSLLGTSSNALTSSFIRTTASTAAAAQYLTFVDSNNNTNAPEQLSTNANLYYYSFNKYFNNSRNS